MDSQQEKKRILVIHTGGTFGMISFGESGTMVRLSETSLLGELFSYVPELHRLAHIEMAVPCNVDSSDMGPEHWNKMIDAIVSRWEDFDGFVIVHGTDTMAYSAAVLSFFLTRLSKPVVLTGSQRPLAELRSDARANIIDAVELATKDISGVLIVFDSKVYWGTRVTKFSSEYLQAFRPHNAPILGQFGVHFRGSPRLFNRTIAKHMRHPPVVDTRICCNVASWDTIPGAEPSDEAIEALIRNKQGLVIRAFGAGTLPVQAPQWLRLADRAQEMKFPIVVTTQCGSGAVNMDSYSNSRAFQERGVVSAGDMSFESTCVKLMIFIGRNIPYQERHQFFQTSLANECSEPHN